ncbi:MAG: hypothetical protein ACM31D_08295 [Bacteroidota bacterium]
MATIYQYVATPSQVGTNVTANISVSIINPGQTLSGTVQTIFISIPTGTADNALTNQPAAMSLSADQATTKAGWAGALSNSQSGWVMKLSGPPISNQQTLTFTLQNVQVNATTGIVSLPITEKFTTTQSGNVLITKVVLPMGIISFGPTQPFTTVPGTATLAWTTQGGTSVRLLPCDYTTPVSGSGPSSGSFNAQITAGPSTQFTLQLWSDNNQYVSSNASVYAGQVTNALACDATAPIDLTDSVTFSWSSAYAVPPLMLSPTPGGTMRVGATGQTAFVPGSMLTDSRSSMTISLQAAGWEGPAQSSVTVTFKPVQIQYLRYADSTYGSVLWGAVNYIPKQTAMIFANGVYTLTAGGPGGPVVQRLGQNLPDLQVWLFTASPSSPNVGDQVTLSYTTANAQSVTINGSSAPFDPSTQTGSTTITYQGPQDLVLVATGNGGSSLSSLLCLPY